MSLLLHVTVGLAIGFFVVATLVLLYAVFLAALKSCVRELIRMYFVEKAAFWSMMMEKKIDDVLRTEMQSEKRPFN